MYTDDGDKDLSLPLSSVKFVSKPDASGSDGANRAFYRVGQDVEAQFGGRSRWFRAKVVNVHPSGVYDLRYEDGDQESCVKPQYIRTIGGHPGPAPSQESVDSAAAAAAPVTKFRVDDVVSVRHLGKGRWYQGTVVTVFAGPTPEAPAFYEVAFDDGAPGPSVSENFMRLVKRPSSLEVGATVEGNYRGRGRWFPGRINKVSGLRIALASDTNDIFTTLARSGCSSTSG
jgi:hypothetical protein